MNLGNIMTLLVRPNLCLQIFKLLTFNFVLVCPSSLSCILIFKLMPDVHFFLTSNVAFAENIHHGIYELVRLVMLTGLASNNLRSFGALTMTMSSLSAILVNRLVLNLRELHDKKLPTTVETAGRFQAALPGLQQPSVRNSSFVRPNRLTAIVSTTRETVAGEPPSLSQQVQTMDVNGYKMEWSGDPRQHCLSGDSSVCSKPSLCREKIDR